MVSRFLTSKEITQVLSDTAKGQVDIVVGTHRLLQKDVDFKDLGLVIIDEEHRFGVVHKERLKKCARWSMSEPDRDADSAHSCTCRWSAFAT